MLGNFSDLFFFFLLLFLTTMDSKISLICLVFLLLLPLVSFEFDGSILNASDSLSPSINRRLVSPYHVFELGFFKLSSNSWYLGIWYRSLDDAFSGRAYVWVANRDNPLTDSTGFLKFHGANLVITDRTDRVIWSSGETRGNARSPIEAELKSEGNFVVRYVSDPDNLLYQSFDSPTDTLLPGMKLGLDSKSKSLVSWKSYDGPSRGNYTFILEVQSSLGLAIDITHEVSLRFYWSGPWIGDRFARVPRIFDLASNSQREPICTFIGTNTSSYSRLRIEDSGLLMLFVWNQSKTQWDMSWTPTEDFCDLYNICGANAFCDMEQGCACLKGYENRTGGCVRETPLHCGENGFVSLRNTSFPHSLKSMRSESTNDVEECQKMCTEDCECSAFSLTNSMQFTSSTCVIWRDDLVDLRLYPYDGLTLYIKQDGKKKGKKKSNAGMIVTLSVGIPVAVAIFSLAICCYCRWKKNQSVPGVVEVQLPIARDVRENPQVPALDFGTVLHATETFSHKIGHGGFGTVYKGRLPDGREIAVKKLSNVTARGIAQFRDEGLLIASLQHVNLVRLYGWSVHEDEGQSSSELSWHTRHLVTKGIARGLTYLQEDSQVKTVHRDLKPENILLDRDMVPKISDFGLARIFQRNEDVAMTRHAAGTSGYMAPEYAAGGLYSTKSDVFSFGVMMLEIISGKRNRNLSYVLANTNLLSVVWKKWVDGNWEEIVDQVVLLESSASQAQQVRRCIGIGLLCVQQVADDRPKMSAVVAMLENEELEVPDSKPPGFLMDQSHYAIPSSSSSNTNQDCSVSLTLETASEFRPR